jgi:VIT1/CCC1 family predicted Fe2+/Mn2+ transporter
MKELSSEAVAEKVFYMTLTGCVVFILGSFLFVLPY